MKVRKPKNSRAAHKHMDAMLYKAMAALGDSFSALELALWSLTADLTPCQRYAVNTYILNWG